jgi:type II secretory pathway pseudopilin PulG
MNRRSSLSTVVAFGALFALLFPATATSQDGRESEPAASLAAALSAACRANETQFENYLTVDNAAAFRALPQDQRAAILKRLSLADEAGKPLLSSDDQNHTVLRCTASEGTAEFRFGDVRTRENLAFVPVAVTDGEKTEFGLVRENGGWRLISLGLVLLDIPQLSKQWAESDLAAREDAAVSDLRALDDAIQTYRRAFGKLPDSLSQLGPAPKDQVSPDQADLVSDHLAAGSDGGYRFRYRIVPGAREDETSFELAAMPDDYGKTGRRSFFVDAAGKVHGADKRGELATEDDPVIP